MSTGSFPLARDRAVNVVLWAVLGSTSLLTGAYFLVRIYRHGDPGWAVAVFELLARAAALTSAGLVAEAMLLRDDAGRPAGDRRRVALRGVRAGATLLCLCLWGDLALFAFAGYHLTTGARILLSGGVRALGQTIEAVGVSPWGIVAGALAAVAAIAAFARLARRMGRLSARAGLVVERRTAVWALSLSVAAVVLLEIVSHEVRDPWQWERETRAVPLAFSITRPEADVASFRVSLRRQPSSDRARVVAVSARPLDDLPDVFVFVVESLRKDVVAPDLMPRLSAFGASAWTFEHPITTGNVTQYAWYGLFCSELPIFFDAAKASPSEHGSVPLAVLRRLGYRVHLFVSPNLAYQGIQDVVFGDGQALVDTSFHPESTDAAERDEAVVTAFGRTVAAQPRGGGVYVVALDSTHFDYSWGARFQPPYTPIGDRTSTAGIDVDARARAALWNRYRDAVAWTDLLLGRALDAIEASGRMGSSYVVVTGDHGEAFWEHGSGTHGSDLSREQVEVGFAMRVPGARPRRLDGVLSLLDVMPTVLYGLGFREEGVFEGKPLQTRVRFRGAGSGQILRGAALTFQGVNEVGYRFALTTREGRALFELDQREPLASKRLSLRGVTDLADAPLVGLEARDGPDAQERLLRETPRIVDDLHFLSP